METTRPQARRDAPKTDEVESEREPLRPEELHVLAAVARLDMETAAAYQEAARLTDDEELRSMLESFCDDHVRHVRELRDCVQARSGEIGEIAIDETDVGRSVLVSLVSSVAAADVHATGESLIGNARLTDATYETALRLIADSEALDIIARGREDERRHLEAMASREKREEHEWHADEDD